MRTIWHKMSHAIPKTVLESLNEVVAGYNKIADAGEEIDDESVADVRDVSEDNARRQKKFFAEIDILDKNGHDYHLTEQGNKLGRLIRFDRQEDAAELYGELLDDWPPTAEILANVDDDGYSLDDLADKVALVTANELTTRRKERGAETIVELLKWTGFLEEEDGIYRISENPRANERENAETLGMSGESANGAEQSDSQVESPPSANGGVTGRQSSVQTGGLDISLNISGSDDPENVRQLLFAIRQGTQEDVDSYEHPNEDE
jgi:hypothetical protein